MGSWLDRWAKNAASAPSPAIPAPSSAPDSRRAFLKKAAVVTGAAWTVPVLQTALAPAYAASGDLGAVCRPTAPRCTNSFCGTDTICGGVEAACTAAAQCVSGGCSAAGVCGTNLPPGALCTTNAVCQYGNCQGGVCGGKGATCSGTGTTQCATSGGLAVSCNGSTCGGIGATCTGTTSTPCATSGGLAVSCNGTTCGGLGATCTAADATTQCGTAGGIQITCSAGLTTNTCGGAGNGSGIGALCPTVTNPPASTSPVCVGGKCKGYGQNPNRCST